jgi:Ca-activated chloride channel family protein
MTTQPLFDVKIFASREQLQSLDTPQLVYLLVELVPPSNQVQKSLPLNISLVIDRSTSMKGERLNKVKAAANLVIEKLSPTDTVSIISYSDRSEVIVPATRLTNKMALESKIRGILASGGTEIYQGLAAGITELCRSPLEKHINHLILLTDGHTYGDADQCLQLAQQSSARGIGISAFGIGEEWNDEFLDQLVAPSGGQSGYVAEPEQIIHYLRQRIQGLGALYAQNVRLVLAFPEVARVKEAFKLSPFAQPITLKNNELQLGAVEGRTPLALLLELSIDPQPAGRVLTLPFGFLANLPQTGKHEFNVKRSHQINVVSQAVATKMPDAVMKAVQIFNLYRMNEQAWEEAGKGNVAGAAKRMEYLTQRFKEAGFTKLAQQAQSETQKLASTGMLSQEGRKNLRYGTRTALTSSLNIGLNNAEEES